MAGLTYSVTVLVVPDVSPLIVKGVARSVSTDGLNVLITLGTAAIMSPGVTSVLPPKLRI